MVKETEKREADDLLTQVIAISVFGHVMQPA